MKAYSYYLIKKIGKRNQYGNGKRPVAWVPKRLANYYWTKAAAKTQLTIMKKNNPKIKAEVVKISRYFSKTYGVIFQ